MTEHFSSSRILSILIGLAVSILTIGPAVSCGNDSKRPFEIAHQLIVDGKPRETPGPWR